MEKEYHIHVYCYKLILRTGMCASLSYVENTEVFGFIDFFNMIYILINRRSKYHHDFFKNACCQEPLLQILTLIYILITTFLLLLRTPPQHL